MTVRKAETKDINGIMSLLYQVAEVHHNGRPDLFKGGSSKYMPVDLEKILADENSPVYVAVDDNDDVLGHAFCVFTQTGKNRVLVDRLTLYIDDICVDQNHRGEHIGTELCKAVIDMAKQKGCYNVTLNVWCLNEGAFAFYKSLGFMNQKITMEMVM